MPFDSGFHELKKKKTLPIYSSGDTILDKMLAGGFHHDLVYLLYGDRRILVDILLKTVVNSFANNDFTHRVAFVDANNRFNPYKVSKLAANQHFSPKLVLEHIFISRAFTWEQMVELLENRISELEDIKIVMISGITTLWPDYKLPSFEGLLKAISGIKETIHKINPLILLTAPIHEHSDIKPKGGKYLQHFGTVLVLILNKERYIEYHLIQHPSMAEKIEKKWIPLSPKKKFSDTTKNTTLDQWF